MAWIFNRTLFDIFLRQSWKILDITTLWQLLKRNIFKIFTFLKLNTQFSNYLENLTRTLKNIGRMLARLRIENLWQKLKHATHNTSLDPLIFFYMNTKEHKNHQILTCLKKKQYIKNFNCLVCCHWSGSFRHLKSTFTNTWYNFALSHNIFFEVFFRSVVSLSRKTQSVTHHSPQTLVFVNKKKSSAVLCDAKILRSEKEEMKAT